MKAEVSNIRVCNTRLLRYIGYAREKPVIASFHRRSSLELEWNFAKTTEATLTEPTDNIQSEVMAKLALHWVILRSKLLMKV